MEDLKLKYQEPFWGGKPPDGLWSMDIVRDGVEIGALPLEGKVGRGLLLVLLLVARVTNCDTRRAS
jgi:hypothetical protein